MIRLALTLALILTTGCTSVRAGRSFSPSRLDQVQPGSSTRAEVHSLLGSPHRSERVGELDVEVHKFVSARDFQLAIISYRGDTVVHVTR